MDIRATQIGTLEFALSRTNERHFTGRLDPSGAGNQPDGSFGRLLIESLNTVSSQQQSADALAVRAVTDPESVNAHDVTIAAAKANMSLSITKAIVDRVVQAYREIQNVR